MALNKKEQSNVQQKLDQLQREQNQLRRGFDYDIWKTRQAFNARKKRSAHLRRCKVARTEEETTFVKPSKTMTNTKRRYSIVSGLQPNE